MTSRNVREHTAVRVRIDRLHENALPRHVLNVDYRAFAKHAQNVFRSLPTHQRELRQMLTTRRP